MSSKNTIAIEDKHMVPFFTKIPISIERGEGVYVWDEEGIKYLDFTSGWGVTCIGHAHPEIRQQRSEKLSTRPMPLSKKKLRDENFLSRIEIGMDTLIDFALCPRPAA